MGESSEVVNMMRRVKFKVWFACCKQREWEVEGNEQSETDEAQGRVLRQEARR